MISECLHTNKLEATPPVTHPYLTITESHTHTLATHRDGLSVCNVKLLHSNMTKELSKQVDWSASKINDFKEVRLEGISILILILQV